MAVRRKDEILVREHREGRWPICGKPGFLHSDRASEFSKSKAYQRGCDDNFIEVILRPPGKPRYGGHIERLIGSMMGRVKFLPGATFSNPKQRGSYDSVRSAKLSIYEVEAWFLKQVMEYHTSRHRMLGASPLATWDRLCAEHNCWPSELSSPDKFYRDFLPVRSARVLRKGLQFKTLEYSSPLLAELRRKSYSRREGNAPIEFRYDPANLSEIYVKDLQGRYQAVPLNYPDQPIVTLWELTAELKRRRHLGLGSSTSALTIAGILKQREALQGGQKLGVRDARAAERLRHHGIQLDGTSASPSAPGTWDRILGGDQ